MFEQFELKKHCFGSVWMFSTSKEVNVNIVRRGYSSGVTADLFRPANLFRGNISASVFVPVSRNFSGFVPGES